MVASGHGPVDGSLTCGGSLGLLSGGMSASGALQARIERAASEASRIEAAVRAWIARRRKRDTAGLHRAQLAALEGLLGGAAARVGAATSLSPGMSSGALYRAAATQERRLAVVEQVLDFFRARFDQRDDGPLGALLDGADEVVRSLYLPAFRAAGAAEPPMPLAYVEPAFSPRAFPREQPPDELKGGDDVVRAVIGRVPFGVVGVPPWFGEGPWTLVYLAHELGHHLQLDLAPGFGLVKSVRETLKQAAVAAGVPGDGSDFFAWGNEVFADAFSIASIGPVAIEALVEIERADDATMVAPAGPRYPCPAVRIALMVEVAQAMGLDGRAARGDVDPEALVGRDPAARTEEQRRAASQVAAAPRVAAALAAQPLARARTLAQICDVRPGDFAAGGDAALWAAALLSGKKRARDASLRGTRLVLAGAWHAWRRACAIEDHGQRTASIAAVRERAALALAENREPITLGGPSAVDAAALGKDAGDFLLARTAEELGP